MLKNLYEKYLIKHIISIILNGNVKKYLNWINGAMASWNIGYITAGLNSELLKPEPVIGD